jgi:plasmid stability protein
MAESKPVSISVRNVDPDLWAEFRILCLKEGKSIAVKLNEVLRGLFDKQEEA